MKCTVKLSGMDGDHKVEGELDDVAEVFSLSYRYSGDSCKVSGKNGDIVMERRGSVDLNMRFTQGRYTDCTLGSGANAGTFRIYTEKVFVAKNLNGLSVRIKYKNGDLKNVVSLIAEKI